MIISNLSNKFINNLSHIYSWWSKVNIKNEEFTLLLLLTVFLLLLISSYTYLIKKQLPLPPGPRPWPLIGNLLSLDPEFHTYFANLARVYGPIFKLHLGKKIIIVVTSPLLAKEILKDQDTTFANRDTPVAGKLASYDCQDIICSSYGPEWRMLRKVCVQELLSSVTLDAVYSLRRREVRETVAYAYKNRSSPINIGEQMFMTVLNVITSMMWGGSLEEGERSSVAAEFRHAVAEMTEIVEKPNVSDFFPGLARFDLQGVEKMMMKLFLKFDKIFNSVIDKRVKIMEREGGKRRGESEKERDFLQFLLQLKDNGDSKTPFTMTHLKALLMDMVVAGTDTTSNTVEWAMAEMMNKPEIIRKAQEELERVVGKDSIVEESHILKLHYLDAVMKEVLRLHPPLPLLVPHCPSVSSEVGGYIVPQGSKVFINVWAIHRDPLIWDMPLEFNPERFLNEKWDYNGKNFNYFPFGSGRRVCVGIHMAERMLMYEVASLLHSFDWRLPEGEKLDLFEKFGIVLKKAKPLRAIPTPRLLDPKLYALD